MDRLRRREEAELQRWPHRILVRLRQHREAHLGHLGDVMPDSGDALLHALELSLKIATVEVHLDVVEFFLVEFRLVRATPRDDGHFLGLAIRVVLEHPASDVHGHVAHTDDGNALARGEVLAGKGRQDIVVKNVVLG